MKSIYFLAAIMALSAYKAQADEVKCLSRVIYAEARGESVSGAVATAQATINRANNQQASICDLSGVNRRSPDKSLVTYYMAIARAALFDRFPSVVKKSDSWNTGIKPRQPGKVERVIDNHVFYVMAPTAEKK